MGWLRDYMSTANPPVSSFGKLAQLSLDHAEWPAHISPKQRSLSTLFSKLDRKQDLDWLRDRIEVQQVLANILSRPLADIRRTMGETPYDAQDRYLRFHDIRYARELDLAQESPPPGIPRKAWQPTSWEHSWWRVNPGTGCTLNRSWLQARSIARCVSIYSRDDLAKVPSRGPVFIEIDATLDASSLALTEEDLLRMRAGNRPVCFAAHFPAPLLSLNEFQASPPTDYLPELVDWVEERLDGSGHFHADRAEKWLRTVALPAGALNNFGDTLGLLGMLDEVHPRSLLAKSLDDLGQHFVRQRVREANEEAKLSPRLAEEAYPALLQCAARILVDGETSLTSPHALDEWTALLSAPGTEEQPDPQWFISALGGALGKQVSKRDLRRAAQKLQPNSFQLVRSLEGAQLLLAHKASHSRDEEGDKRQLRPHWLVSLLTSRAALQVLEQAPESWGRVLLSGPDSNRIVSSLIDGIARENFKPCFALLDDFDASRPELVAALESVLIALGVRSLEGQEIPDDLVEPLLSLVSSQLFLINQLPVSRLTFQREEAAYFQPDFFLVSLLALCRQTAFPLRHIDPVRSEKTAIIEHFMAPCLRVLDTYRSHISLGVGIIDCLDALCPRDLQSAERVAAPACLLAVDSLGQSKNTVWKEAFKQCPLDTLIAYLKTQGEQEKKSLGKCWSFLSAEPHVELYFTNKGTIKKLWQAAPETVLRQRAQQELAIDWHCLLPHQYSEWLGAQDSPTLPPSAAIHCPVHAALLALEERGISAFHPKALKEFMPRMGARIGPFVHQIVRDKKEGDLRTLLNICPPDVSSILAEALPPAPQLLNLSKESLEETRLFLLNNVQRRHQGFLLSYEILTKLHASIGPLRQLGQADND